MNHSSNLNYKTAVKMGYIEAETAIKELDTQIENMFFSKPFAMFYDDVHAEYKVMGFKDELTDTQRIDEYKYIYQMLIRYIHKNQDIILNVQKDWEQSLKEIKALIEATADDTSRERKKLVYHRLRNNWLSSIYSLLEEIVYSINEFKEKKGYE